MIINFTQCTYGIVASNHNKCVLNTILVLKWYKQSMVTSGGRGLYSHSHAGPSLFKRIM